MKRTIQNVIDFIIASVPGTPREDSVDVFKCGDPAQEVTGIITTFTASMHVLRKAVELGANLVITHEPTFYENREQTDWMADDPILQAKREFIAQNHLAIWRFHDYWHMGVPTFWPPVFPAHMYQPDGILTGMLKALGWEEYQQLE